MSFTIRPPEVLWADVVEMQKEKAESEIVRGVKRLMDAAGSVPPGGKGPSNLNNWAKINKYLESFDLKNANKIDDLMSNINKQSITKFLKYFA